MSVPPSFSKQSALRQTTPFPNALLDEIMPNLRDTEWRLLCVVVRQTLGRFDKSTRKRKESDWLTQSQLIEKTGRNSAALSLAIERLVDKGYIEVKNVTGRLLTSPSKRRQSRGKCFYGLSPQFTRLLADEMPSVRSSTQSNSQSELPEHRGYSHLERNFTKSEYRTARKANTTKEILTKENVTKEESHNIEDMDLARQFISLFEKMAGESFQSETDTALSAGDSERLITWLGKIREPDWTMYLKHYFSSDLEYVKKRRFSLTAFINSHNVLFLKKPQIHAATSTGLASSPKSV